MGRERQNSESIFSEGRQFAISNSPSHKGNQFSIVVNDDEAQYPITIDPLSTSPNWVVNFGYSFGSACSPAGDINGDGYGDVIVGAKETTTNFTNDGKVYLFLGSSTGLSSTPAWTSIGANQSSAYGNSISTAGDVNGDGYSDVIIGEPGYKEASVSKGRALVYYGSASGLPGKSKLDSRRKFDRSRARSVNCRRCEW
ncbi:MAG: VCBS repeat-containing protein [Ignavibacteria bacterium]|nr:VCBS repeat-containing protein [Ignavibacteria bacterium]